MARHRAGYRVEGLRRENRDRDQPVEARVRRIRMMHGPVRDQNDRTNAAAGNTLVAALERGLGFCNNVIVVFAAVALIAACVVLSHSVLTRALLHSPNYWQDEAAAVLAVRGPFIDPAHVARQRSPIRTHA